MPALTINLLHKQQRTERWMIMRTWRDRLGLSTRRVAELLDISQSTVCMRENPPGTYSELKQGWADANPEKIKSYRTRSWQINRKERLADNKRRRNSPRTRLRILAQTALRRGQRTGLPCDELDAIMSALSDTLIKNCACCGVSLNYALSPDKHNGKQPDFPSIDRVDNSRGYTLDNIAITCFFCNVLKANATVTQLETIITYMRKSPVLSKRTM